MPTKETAGYDKVTFTQSFFCSFTTKYIEMPPHFTHHFCPPTKALLCCTLCAKCLRRATTSNHQFFNPIPAGVRRHT